MHLKTSNSAGRRANKARPITVHFQIPRNSISKLRTLAIEKDPRLVDLGVLAVQISDDESIVLGIELEKAKRKDHSVSRNISTTPSTAFTPRTMMNFESPPRNIGNLSSYSKQFVTTRNETFTSKTKKPVQNAAMKKKAKDTLNAARRGSSRGRGRVGNKGAQTSGAVARASTWEMVYSHIGLAGDHRRKSANPPYLEPTIACQASGIANVPLAQPELSRENTSSGESTKKRESAARSPPLKSPGNSAMYSEDDSSVSSSPCSHSPMNQEELLNLFVDSNFSATSVLKQLAESRVKEDEKNTDDIESSDKQTELDHVWSTWHSDASAISPKTSSPDDKSKTDSSVNGKGLSHFAFSSPISTTSTTFTDTSPMKRPSTLVEDTSMANTSSGSALSEKSAKRQRRSFAELVVKKEMLDISNKLLKQELEKSSPASAMGITTSQVSSQPQETTTTTTNTATTTTKLPSISMSTPNAALRNFNQYGYYYSSEDLKALIGSKAVTSKSLAKGGSLTKATKPESPPQHQPSLNTVSSANISLKPTSTIASQPSQVSCDDKPMDQHDDSISSSSSSPTAVNQDTNTLFLQHFSKSNNEGQSESKIEDDTENLTTAVNDNSNVLGDSVSCNNDSVHVTSPSLQPNSLSANSKESTINVPTTSSSSLVPSSCSDIKPPEDMPSDSSSFRRGGQCYALSYVYPMGTVWYPYVAITPYAVLGNNQNNGSEMNDKDQAKASNGLNSYSSTQYIDLASSLRYWQQLSLLYKNKLLAPTNVCIPNILTGCDKNQSASSLSSNTVTTTSASIPFKETSSCSGSSSNKPLRRASVIVTAKDMDTYHNEFNNRGPESNRISTPESTSSLESIGPDAIKSEVPLVIDNCDRLIEEQCHRMSEVFTTTSEDITPNGIKTSSSNDVPPIPSLSFIPDSSIAYVNIGNNSCTKKSVGNGKDNKGKSKRRKSTKSI